MSKEVFSKIDFEKYSNKWVALSSDRQTVAGSGAHPRTALKRAYSSGEECPILIKVPKEPGTYILLILQ